jgi:hypothetical protein
LIKDGTNGGVAGIMLAIYQSTRSQPQVAIIRIDH